MIGYESQKENLPKIPRYFSRKKQQCLLYGDSGTGKSSSIKALLNEYYKMVKNDRSL
ncbi:MAG: DUF815 domain-containing protein [Faecalibacillus faecis]